MKPIEWEELSDAERMALAAAGESSPLAFTALWFNVSQGDSFRTNWHHHYFNYAAERMLSGENQVTVVNIPPGGTKTEFWSIHLPAYCMVKYPRVRVLNGSYSKSLVEENSDRTRGLIKTSEFQSVYDMPFGKDRADSWTIERDGKTVHQVFGRSNGGQITGSRGGYMTDGFSGYVAADDWDKPDDMFSQLKRNRSHTRLVNTLRSRLAVSATTPFFFVQQRLHIDDSTSFMLSGGMGLKVSEHINIPALVNEEYIENLPDGVRERCIRDVCSSPKVDGYWSYWPAKESIESLMALRDAHPYTFISQYMQQPDTLEGGIFRDRDFVYFGDDEDSDLPTPPAYEYRFITADTAQKTNTWNDWTVLAEWGVYKDRIYRLNMKRARMEADDLRREFISFVNASWAKNGKENGNLRKVMVEDKSSGTGLIQEAGKKVPIPITAIPRNTDKLTRAMDAQPHHLAGKVALPYGDSDNFEFVSEVASFSHDDSHKHDDQTDVMVDAIDTAFIQPAIKPTFNWAGL